MPYGTSKNWDRFNEEEKDRRHGRAGAFSAPDATEADFASRSTDNLYETRKYLIAFNHPHTASPEERNQARKAYHQKLKEFNFCGRCKAPIIVKSRLRNGQRVTVGTVKSHFELKLDIDTGRMVYSFVDGTGRNIEVRYREQSFRVKRRKFGKLRNVTKTRRIQFLAHILENGGEFDVLSCPCEACSLYILEDGKRVRNDRALSTPLPKEYQLVNSKCRCNSLQPRDSVT